MSAAISSAIQRSIELVCPACRTPLPFTANTLCCSACAREYPLVEGFPDLIIGERYDDPTSDEAILNEEITNRRTVTDYYIPLFERLFTSRSRAVRILSLGCGVGADVDALCDQGWDAFGIDNGKRTKEWKRRAHPERLFMANGKHMPFPDESFDAVFCGCVFPHIGVQGASYEVTGDYYAQRLALATEITRVLKPHGVVIASNPNRLFPFDIFHEHTASRMRMRFSPPWKPLLLSRRDYEKLFRDAGCLRASGLPVRRYWSFANSRRTLKGRLASMPVRILFWMASTFAPLRTSFLNPWIIVKVEKGGERTQ